MKKEKYERTALELIRFSTADIICTSAVDDYEGWNPQTSGPESEGYEGWNPH